mgnify:CR=1 FL=1
MATCTQCGAELKPGAKFCENCGAKVSVPQPAAQPAAVPQAPGSADSGCTATPTACTDAPTAAGKRRQSLCRRRTCRPAAPDERSESLRRQCARHTAADRRRHTALRQKHTPGCSPCCHAAATRRHGRQPLRQCSPRRQAQAPRAPMTPKRMILIAIPVIFLLMIIVTMISGSIRTGKPNASDPNQGTWEAAYAEIGGSVTQVEDAFGSGFLMDLNDKGKCVVTVDGTKSYGKWTLNGGAFQLDCGGLSCTGTLQDEILTLNDVQGQGVTLYFVKSGSTMQQPLDGDSMTQDAAAGSDTDVGIYVLESASDSEYTLSKEELALVDMEDFYIELRADGTGETYMEDFVTFQWKDGSFYALTDPNTPAMTYTREGDLLTIEFDGMTMVFKRSDTKPEIDPALLDGGDDEYDGDDWIDGPDEPDPPYTYDDGNTYADLGNTNWYGWFRMENYKNVPNRDYFDTDTYDCWGYIGESEDGSHYFEVYRDGMPDDPVITMWVNVYDDHIEPILDGYDWVLDQNITKSDAYKFNLYPYNDSISLFMYDYEGEDGTACAISFYMRLDGTEWNEELEELPPRYEEYKAALANK